MTKILTLLICAALVVGAAVVHGSATHRWNMLAPSAERSTAVHAHVIRMGDFTYEDVPSELPIKERSAVSCRRYSSPTRDNMIVVSVTSGPPGAVSTHTPDVCYPGSGYRTISEPKKEILNLPDGTTATCLVAEYEKKNSTAIERHRIRWSWSVNGSWTIPDRPRFAFLSEQELFKLYVVTPIADTDINRLDAENPATTAFIAQVFAQYATIIR